MGLRHLTKSAIAGFAVLVLGLTSCSRETPSIQADITPDACSLLTSDRTQSSQGQPITKTSAVREGSNGLTISRCEFTLARDSITLTVTAPATPANATDVRKTWERMFRAALDPHRNDNDYDDQLRDRVHMDEREREEEKSSPVSIDGIGEQAFWVPSATTGRLFVLRGPDYIELQIKCVGDATTRFNKARALADSVLERLN